MLKVGGGGWLGNRHKYSNLLQVLKASVKCWWKCRWFCCYFRLFDLNFQVLLRRFWVVWAAVESLMFALICECICRVFLFLFRFISLAFISGLQALFARLFVCWLKFLVFLISGCIVCRLFNIFKDLLNFLEVRRARVEAFTILWYIHTHTYRRRSGLGVRLH